MAQQGATGSAGGLDWKWLLLSIDGRIPRSTYLLKFLLPAWGIGIVLSVLDNALGLASSEYGGPLGGIWGLLMIWPSIAAGVKRLHDRNQSGWWLLILLVPLVGLLFWIINMWCMKGTTGANRFGPDPLGGAS